jgi:hypothetical protein
VHIRGEKEFTYHWNLLAICDGAYCPCAVSTDAGDFGLHILGVVGEKPVKLFDNLLRSREQPASSAIVSKSFPESIDVVDVCGCKVFDCRKPSYGSEMVAPWRVVALTLPSTVHNKV